ncbi:MAG: glycosyltransferase family 2 protein [Candidatus Nanohaloarchaea archaeon]|nr:glycosyltransferase family 2 protein [Candidatus Nanohaloarchaea archaeon]
MPTKNRLEPCLPESLEAMEREVPVNRFIVIDAHSTDGTVEHIQEFCDENGIDLVLERSDAPLPKARQRGIELVETDWFLFLDSDVVLLDGYFDTLTGYIDEGVGAVQGRKERSTDPDAPEYAATDEDWISRRSFRGGTHSTLIRTAAVDDIDIPADLRTWEDEYIRRYVEGKRFRDGRWQATGEEYEWVFAPDALFRANEEDSFDKTEYEGRLFAKYGFKPAYRVIGRALRTRDGEDIAAATGYIKEVMGL